jgi:O-antigen/teichoic acid export membrane protein
LSFSTILIVLGPEIATALFWKSYVTSWELLIFSWGFLIFSLLSTFNYSVLAWMWKVKERVYITWIAAILTVITTYIGIKLWNINGAGIAFWLSNFYTWFLSLYLLKKENFSLTFNRSFILKNCFLFLTLWLLLYFTKWTIFNIDWNRRYMILTLIWVSLAFYICIWIFNIGTLKKLGSEIKNLKG